MMLSNRNSRSSKEVDDYMKMSEFDSITLNRVLETLREKGIDECDMYSNYDSWLCCWIPSTLEECRDDGEDWEWTSYLIGEMVKVTDVNTEPGGYTTVGLDIVRFREEYEKDWSRFVESNVLEVYQDDTMHILSDLITGNFGDKAYSEFLTIFKKYLDKEDRKRVEALLKELKENE